jgi:2-methylcitrate dehydratase PrpD
MTASITPATASSPVPGATARLGAWVAAAARQPLPADVRERAGVCLLDALGLGILGAGERTAQAARLLAPTMAAGPQSARVWADGRCIPLSDAVTANAIATHAQFHDDSEHESWSHPGSFVVPVAVCLGDAMCAPLEAVLRAIAIGYAAVAWSGAHERVARALIGRGIRTSPTLGTVAAAATAAALLGLDETAATDAVAISACITGGVLEPVRAGSDEWRVQNGHAARGGLLAAQLAAAGVRGAPQALEGTKGLARSLAGLAETPPEWSHDPDITAILRGYVKPFCTLGDNMAAARAARLLFDDCLGARLSEGTPPIVDGEAMRAVRVTIWRPYTEYPGTAYRGPYATTVQALASTVFAVAAMLIYGELEYDKAEKHREDPRILALLPRIAVLPDDAGTHLDARVEVDLDDGHVLAREAREAPATWLYPTARTASDTFVERIGRAGGSPAVASALAGALFNADRPATLAGLLQPLLSAAPR